MKKHKDTVRLEKIIETAKWASLGDGRRMALGWLTSRRSIDAIIRQDAALRSESPDGGKGVR